MTFDLDAYLARIGIAGAGAGAADSAGLARLQEAHLLAFAFENLDPLLGRVPALDPQALQRKLVFGGRGGYCFEQNGLFALALQAQGFAAEPVLARVRNGAAHGGTRSHLAHVVHLEGREWLVDVGFGGGGPRRPVPLERYRVDYQLDGAYRVIGDRRTGETVLQVLSAGAWSGLYGFDRTPVPRIDIEAANFLCATWDQAPFSANLMLHRLTPAGHIGVFNTKVSTVCDRVKTVRTSRDADDLARLLSRDFELRVAGEEVARIAGKLGLSGEPAAQSVA